MEYFIGGLAGVFVAGISYLILNNFYQKYGEVLENDFLKVKNRFFTLFPGRFFFFLLLSFFIVGYLVSWFLAPVVFLYPLFKKFVKEQLWKKRLDKIDAQLVDFLNFYASSIKAGASLLQGFDSAVKASPDPLASSLKPVVDEVRMGKKLVEAIIDWAKRIDSREGYIVGTSLTLFQETGGNLTEVLLKISDLVKRRVALKNKIDALTAMGKLQAIVMIILGPVVTFLIAAMAPDMFNAAIRNGISIFLFVIAAGLEFLAIIVMRRLIKIEY